MKRFSQLLSLGIALLVSACMADVEAPKNEPSIPTVSYDEETMTRVSVILNGSVPANVPGLKDYGFEVAEGSFSTGKVQVYAADDQHVSDFSCVATLTPGSYYAIRTFFTNGRNKKYSEEQTFPAPRTSAATLTDVTYSGGKIKAKIIDDGGRTINEVGFCWGKENDIRAVKRSSKNQAVLQKDNTFSLDVSHFKLGETYYMLAYAENSDDASDIIGYSRNLLQVTVSEDDYVDIEDDNFEAYLVANFDADHNGWMSFGELKAITAIDVSTDNITTVKEINLMPDLRRLSVAGSATGIGKLTKLNVGSNPQLTTLICSYNQIDSLVLINCPLLDTLSCSGNKIKDLDVSKERNLTCLNVASNPIESKIDISNCEALTTFTADNCSFLDIIYVWLNFDENEYADFSKDPDAEYIISPHINIPIPDANFKKYLVENFDKNGDGEINGEEAFHITEINVITDNIESLSGIEFFTNLSVLSCYGGSDNNAIGKLSKIDVRKNTVLRGLFCSRNQLERLDVSNNPSLIELNCSENHLVSLDLSSDKGLTVIYCYNNNLTSLDISENTKLTTLMCHNNQLTSLDLSQNTELTTLMCNNNQLTALDVSSSTKLVTLWCHSNQLTSCDLSQNTELTTLLCDNNQLTALDLSHVTRLTRLSCGHNQLTSLDLSHVTGLTQLSCGHNQLTSLDVTPNTQLTYMSCRNNTLTTLDLSQNKELTELDCSYNPLTAIDVSQNTSLKTLHCYSNQLNALDVSHNIALKELICDNNRLIALDVSNNLGLSDLVCGNNPLTTLDVSQNDALRRLTCINTELTILDVSRNLALTYLWCEYNPYLTEIWLKTGQTISDFTYDPTITTIKYKE